MGKPWKISIDWGDPVLGFMGKRLMLEERGLEPGASMSFQTFGFDYGKVGNATVEVLGKEETELLDGARASCLHLVTSTDATPGLKVHEWLDDNHDVAKTSVSVLGVTIESFRSTRERAMHPIRAGLRPDVVKRSILRSNVRLPRPYALDSILYRFRGTGSEETIPPGFGDDRQEFLENDGRTAKVLIRAKTPAKRQTRPIEKPALELLEYLEANPLIQSDHPPLRAKALEVVGQEADAWKAAGSLEEFVHDYIEDKSHGTSFATAAEVFEEPKGDCSEHSVLLVALCRAAGIPARVAFGYLYASGIFGGHMWVEVWIHDQWYPLDATLSKGRAGPTHITMSTSSFRSGTVADALSNTTQSTGIQEIRILEYTRGKRTVVVEKDAQE
jgi:transglutaminase-like putative cysteine protease